MDNPNFEPSAVISSEQANQDLFSSDISEHQSVPVNDNTDNQQHQTAPEITTTPINVTPQTSNTEPAGLEKDPVSILISNILHDPATLKLLIVIISILSLILVSPVSSDNYQINPYIVVNVSADYQRVASMVINVSSLIYSILTLLVTVYKNEEKIEKSQLIKKVFIGRNVYWHEIHSPMTLTLALANLSCIVLNLKNPVINFLLFLVYTFEFVAINQKSKLFVTEKNVPQCNCKITKCFLGLFQRHPLKFNVIQWACFISAFVLYCNEAHVFRSYFCYCSVFAITGSSLPLLFKLFKGFELSKWYFSSPKNHTYLSITITVHAGLAVLTNSVDFQWYGMLPELSPIGFSILCIIFALSFFDLYSQAIYHKSRAVNDTSCQNPLIVKTEQQRKQQPFRNLPTIIENPLGIDGVKEVYEY